MAGHKPHILLVGGDGRPSGVPSHIVDLSRALAPMARVSVVSEPDEGGFSELEARHIAVPGLASRLSPSALRQGYGALVETMAREAPDIVWLHARLPVILGRRALSRGDYKGRVAVTYHGLPFGAGHRAIMSHLSKRLETRLARTCPPLDMVFLTETQRTAMEDHLGPLAGRHGRWVLGNASHLGALGAVGTKPAKFHLVMTGRAGWQKNLEAAAQLMPHFPDDVALSLCGIGTDAPAFQERLKEMAGPAADRLHLLGPLDDVRPLLASADGYLMTSRYEGEPIGALEAWEAGLPVFLAPFDGARSLARHPHAQVLEGGTPAARAAEIMAGLQAYLADREGNSARVRQSWAAHHGPEAFGEKARQLVEAWL